MKIGFLLPSLFASQTLYPNRIFAPKELAVHLVDGLVERGHEAVVFSAPDFASRGKLIAGSIDYMQKKIPYHKLRNDEGRDREIRTDEVIKRNFEITVTAEAYQYALHEGLDLIHAYHDFVFSPHYFSAVANVPTVYTLHDPLPPENTFEYAEFNKFRNDNYISISDAQRRSSLPLNFVDTVYHGVHLSEFPFQQKASDYILFMGRLVPEKGLHSAIQTSLRTGVRLEIGTELPDHNHENQYFQTQIKPYLSDPLIEEPGIVTGKNKTLLYKQAQALLFPIEWEEPFGMVMIEAMATGTPVIAFNHGSVSEIVKDGVTGYIVDQDNTQRPGSGGWIIKKTGLEGLVEAVKSINHIDRQGCRKHVEANFTVETMVKNHEKVYQKIIKDYNNQSKDIIYEGSSRRI